MSDTTGVLSEAGTTYHSRAPEAPRICCMLFCFALSYHMSLRTKFLVMSVAVSAWKRCSGRVCLLLFVGGLVYCLLCLCLFTCSSVRCMLCFVFVFVFLRVVYSMLSDSLDCPFLIVF